MQPYDEPEAELLSAADQFPVSESRLDQKLALLQDQVTDIRAMRHSLTDTTELANRNRADIDQISRLLTDLQAQIDALRAEISALGSPKPKPKSIPWWDITADPRRHQS